MRREQAAIYGYMTVEPGAVMATHLQEISKRHADECFQETPQNI